jgi:NAD(P)-dependent dehydrogenase (short-subunit alcohol dehydrogenase family)
MSDLLADTVAVVTGAASGNGRAIAVTFAENGADVVVADLQEEPREGGTPTHERIMAETDADATFAQCDVSDADDIEAAVKVAEQFGAVDVMVNNAGITLPESFPDIDEATYDKIMDVNAKGVYLGSAAAARRMRDGDGGAIINISSDAGIRATASKPVYAASKGAVRLLTYALAGNLGDYGIRVNAIHPGVTETAFTRQDTEFIGSEHEERVIEQIPSGRIGQPKDMADAALFLASDLAEYVNGESLVVDGGRLTSV